jgi:hypothetical protein
MEITRFDLQNQAIEKQKIVALQELTKAVRDLVHTIHKIGVKNFNGVDDK